MSVGQYLKIKFIRVFNYEYWPFYIFYSPMYLYGLYLAFRSRSFTYFTTTNPCMKYGGVMGESKYKILQLINPDFRPLTVLVKSGTPISEVIASMVDMNMQYPVIVKPEIGERGIKVEKINSEDELISYHQGLNENYMIQEFIRHEHEVGVLYYKMPGERTGHISSVVIKGFLYLVGDGQHTFQELLKKMPRAYSRTEYFKNKFSKRLDDVLADGEKCLLEPIGNHNRGTTFLSGNHLINDRLINVFDKITDTMPGFFYGRFDLKVKSFDDLYLGRNLVILELNGVSSEPAHLYDPSYSILKAYNDIARHMKVIYDIAKENHKRGVQRASLFEFLKDLNAHFSFNKNRKRDA